VSFMEFRDLLKHRTESIGKVTQVAEDWPEEEASPRSSAVSSEMR